MKRIGSLTLAALLGVAAWYAGPGLRVIQQQAFAQEIQDLGVPGAYLLSYYDVSTAFDKSEGGYGGPGHSGGAGDALLRIVNAGNFEGFAPTPFLADSIAPPVAPSGDVCANIYVFNDVQEMQECCQCDLSANSLKTISVITGLTSNPLISSESTEAGVIKILGVRPLTAVRPLPTAAAAATGTDPVCRQSVIPPLPRPSTTTGAATFLPLFPLAEGLHAWINHTESMASNQAGFTPPFGFLTSTSVEEFKYSDLDAGEIASLDSQCSFINLHGSGHGICTCGFGD